MYVYKIVILFLLPIVTYAEFDDQLKYRWNSGFNISINSNFKAGSPIKDPAGIYQNILELHFLNKDFKQVKDCLIYQVPSKENDGNLKIVTASIKENCKEKIYETPIYKVSGIRNFGFDFKENKLELLIDTKKYSYVLYNLNQPLKRQIYDSGKINNKLLGVQISFVDTKHGDKLEVGEVCAGYTNDCKPQNNLCHLCPSAVTEVLSDRCGGVIMRYCKDITCGQKGAPACIRGAKASEYKGPVCIPGSPLGFCQKPYKVFCENGELICR